MKWKASTTQPTVSGPTTSTPKAPGQGLSRHVQRLGVALALLGSALPAAAAESHLPYLDGPRASIQRGVQAVLLCNGVFTSERPLEAVFREELAYLKAPLGGAKHHGAPGSSSQQNHSRALRTWSTAKSLAVTLMGLLREVLKAF